MKKLKFILPFVVVLLLSGNTLAQETLRYNLKVGETYGLKQFTIQNIEQSVSGIPQNVKNTFNGDVVLTVKDKTDDVYTGEIIFESMLFKMESAMGNMTFDSGEETPDMANPLNKTFSIIVGHPFQMTFDNRGNIIEVKGFEEVSNKIVAAFGDNPQQGEQMEKALSGQFSNENMKQSLGSMLLVYPKEKVKAGTKWSNKTKVIQPIPINNTINYNIESVDKERVIVSGTGTMNTPEGHTKEEMGMIQHFNLNGNLSISANIDVRTGWPTEIKLNQNLDGSIAVESPQLPAPMEIPMKIKIESSYIAM